MIRRRRFRAAWFQFSGSTTPTGRRIDSWIDEVTATLPLAGACAVVWQRLNRPCNN